MSVDEQGITPDQLTDQQARIADAQRMAPADSVPQTAPNQASPAPAATPANPATATPAPTMASASAPHPLSRALDAVLKSATGGDVYYVDANGQRQKAPQTRGNLGKTLIAATLAGLLSKDEYRQTPYGPVRDWTGTAGNAMEASNKVLAERRAQPQKLSDEMQTRKLMTIQNNANLIALQSAQVRLANEKNDYKVKNDSHVAEMFSPFKEMEDDRLSSNDLTQPKTFVENGRGLTNTQVLSSGHKLTDSNVVQEGWQDVWDDSAQRMIPEPTYAVLNPELKNIKLSPKVADTLSRINSQYKNIHEIVGGDVKIPVNAYVSAQHDYAAVTIGTEILNQLSTEVGGKPVTQAMVEKAAREGRDGKTDILPTLYKLSHGVGADNTPDKRPENLLDIMIHSPNGDKVLGILGMTPAQADAKKEAISLKKESDLALAKEGGVGDKSPAPPEQVAATYRAVQELPEEDQHSLEADFNPKGTTVGELKHINDKVQQIRKDNKEMALREGDPEMLTETGNRVVFENDPSSLNQILSARQNVRMRAANIIHDIAQKAGLDTTEFTPAALQAKSDTVKDYSGDKKGSTGSQIASFNAFLGHTAGAVDAEKRLEGKTFGLTNTPMVNTATDILSKQAVNDPDWKAYETSLLPVQNEISNFLSAGYAVKEEDARLMRVATDKHETPARITASLRQLAETADVRLAALGQRYLDTVHSTYPSLISTDSANTLRRLGINSKAIPLAEKLPRGWQGTVPTTMTDLNMAKAFVRAASGDKAKAQQLAKNYGWILN
jgi:hypothetical protein